RLDIVLQVGITGRVGRNLVRPVTARGDGGGPVDRPEELGVVAGALLVVSGADLGESHRVAGTVGEHLEVIRDPGRERACADAPRAGVPAELRTKAGRIVG